MGAEPDNLAAILTRELFTVGAGRLRELNFNAAENQALSRIWEAAFKDLLEFEQFGRKLGNGTLWEDVFREFIGAEGAADALLDLVLEEGPPRLEVLGRRFEAVVMAAASPPVDFRDALAALTRGLIKALATETRAPGNSLGGRVSLLRAAAIHSSLKKQTESLEKIGAAVAGLEQRLSPQAKYSVVFLGQSTGTVIGDDAQVRQEISPLLEQTLADIKAIVAAVPPLGKGIDTLVELLGGISGISADYAGRIKNFLIEYLGTPDKPVPFGGRQEQLADLDRWLTNLTAHPYCLLAAEAGRGKSALLARWADSLVSRGAARVIFIPVSIRFNTAAAEVTFTALAARLSEVYGEPVKWASLTSQQWREICLKYLGLSPPGETPLLIILDGLDEASDWRAGPDIFPLAPPPGIRIVVSARYLAGDMDERGWLDRLRWGADLARNLPLPTLTRAGVSEVLAAMGNPLNRLATQVDVISELFRLSQGDPLLVRLYVEALLPYGNRAAAIRPEDLPSIQEGLAGYFERWWEDQRSQWEAQRRNEITEKEDVLKFLNVCASALGPLTREDIAAVVGGNLTAGLRIRTVASDVARFVIGDGERGYVFGHPRLGYFFWDQMTEQERAGWEESFLNYGRRTLESLNASELAHDKAPAYALRYYGAHLERAKAQTESLWGLVSEGWLRAWYALEGSYAGFLNDTERAWRAAETLQARRGDRGVSGDVMAVQCRSALCHASVTALSVGIPTQLLGLAKEHGVLTPLQALVLARQIPDEKLCADALAVIARGMPEWLQEDVLAAVQRFESEATRAWTLGKLAPHLSDGLRNLAVEYARSFLNPRARALALSELAPYLGAQAGDLALREALTTVKEIEDVRVRSRTLSNLSARVPPGSPLLNDLLTVAREVEDLPSRARALTSLIPLLTSPEREKFLSDAREAASQVPDPYSRALLLARLAPFLDEAGRGTVMSLILSYIKSSFIYEERLTGLVSLIAPHLPQHHLESAVEWTSGRTWTRKGSATALDESRSREQFFKRLEPIREKLGMSAPELAHLLEAIIKGHLYEINAELSVYEVLPFLSQSVGLKAAPQLTSEQARELGRAAQAYHDAVVARESTTRTRQSPPSLALLLPYLPPPTREEVCRNVLSAANDCDLYIRADLIAALADYLPQRLINHAMEKLDILDPSHEQVQARARLLLRLPEDERETLIPGLVEAATRLENEEERVRTLTELASLPPEILNETRRKEILRGALEAAQAIHDRWEATQFKVNLAKTLSGERQAVVMESVLEQIFQIQNGEALASLLQDLLPSVPESVAGRMLELLLTQRGALDANEQVKSVLALLPRLTETERGRAVEALLGRLKWQLQPPLTRAWLAVELSTYLSPEQMLATLVDASDSLTSEERLMLVIRASRYLADDTREAMLGEVLKMVDDLLATQRGANLLVQVLKNQPEKFQSALAERLWEAINPASSRLYWWTNVVFSLRLLPYLNKTSQRQLIRELLTSTKSLDDYQWAEVCRSIARFTPPDLLPDVFDKATAINNSEYRGLALASLVHHLGMELRGDALMAIRDTLGSAVYHLNLVAKTLSGIAPYTPEDEKSEFARGILRNRTPWGWNSESEAKVLRALTPFLVEDCLADALSFVRACNSPSVRVKGYAFLCPRLPQDLRDEALKEALSDISKLVDRHALTAAFTQLGPVLSDETWKGKALQAASKVADGIARVRSLTALAAFLPDRLKAQAMSQALEVVNNIQERGPRTLELMSLATHMPPVGRLLQDYIRAVLALRYTDRVPALRVVAPRLAVWAGAQPEAAYTLWNECLHACSQHPRPAFFNEMNALLPFTLALTQEEEKEGAILSILNAGQDATVWWP